MTKKNIYTAKLKSLKTNYKNKNIIHLYSDQYEFKNDY